MNKHLIIIATLFLILGFQNCSNTASFDADGALVAKTDVSLQDDGSNTYDGVIDEIADEMPVSNPPSSPPSSGVVVVPTPSPTPAPNYNGGDRNYGGRDDDDDDHDDDDDRDYDRDHDEGDDNDYNVDHGDDDSSSHATATHVCILESTRGNSVRLGHSSGDLSQDTSAVNDVCMSEKACLETVSKAFAVKGAEKRGYCKESNGSSNFVKMSDKEVEDAIAKEMLKRIMSSN